MNRVVRSIRFTRVIYDFVFLCHVDFITVIQVVDTFLVVPYEFTSPTSALSLIQLIRLLQCLNIQRPTFDLIDQPDD